MENGLNMNGHMLYHPKLGGNLNLNGNEVWDNNTALFSYFGGAIRFTKPVVWPGMICRLMGTVATITQSRLHTFTFPQFWTPFVLFSYITNMELKIDPPNDLAGGSLSVHYNTSNSNDNLLKFYNIQHGQKETMLSHLFLVIPPGTTGLSFKINNSKGGSRALLFVDFVA